MADFELEPYRRDDLEGMTALFNAETAFEPYVAPLDPDRFITLVESKSYFDPAGLLVARRNGEVVGWVHACVAAGSEGHHDPADRVPRIRMLMFPKHELKVGNTLTREAIGWLKQTGQTRILALHAQVGYPFYRGLWFGGEPMGPTTIPQMQMALEVNGFDNTQESIFITKTLDGPPQPTAATVALEFVEAPAEMRHEPMRESWIGFKPMRTRAYIGDEEAGSISWVVIPYLDRLGAPCMNIWGLGVREQHRRKGIASALIAHALISAYTQGARYASVGTQLWNAPAHATYVTMGFRPHAILVGRTLESDRHEAGPVMEQAVWQTHYLIDFDYALDEKTLHASMGHLLVYNPGAHDTEVEVTIYFEDQEPASFSLIAPGGTSTETNYTKWPVTPNRRFALAVHSPAPVICQATIGWNNAGNDYTTGARTHSPHGVRECARSYHAITQLAHHWYLADGLVLDNPARIWVRESEWLFMLNPGDAPASVTVNMQYRRDDVGQHAVMVAPRRLAVVYMDDLVQRNRHYGAHIAGDQPIAAQWMRVVKWDDASEIMTFWSAPCVAG